MPALNASIAVPVTGFGEIEAVTPLGNPETERLTLRVNPYSGVTSMGTELDDPGPTDVDPGLLSENAGTAIPRRKLVLAFSAPDVPVIVTLL